MTNVMKMSTLLMLLTPITTPVVADGHGYRLTTGNGAEFVFISKPTAQENHDLCVSDGEALIRRNPDQTYTCTPR